MSDGCGPDIVKYFIVEPGGSGSATLTGVTGNFSVCSGTTFLNTISGCTDNVNFNNNIFYNNGEVLFDSTLTACTGIYTSNIYGCSPITVQDDLILNSGLTFNTITNNNILDRVLVVNSGGTVEYRDVSSIAPEAKLQNTYFVSSLSGDNSTALVGDINKPWKTITGARDALLTDALSGQTLIYVYPGIYDEEEIQYENGNMYLSPGVLIKPPRRFHSLDIIGVNTGTKTFTVNGNWATYITVGSQFKMIGSTGNDGIYTVFSVSDVAATTEIITVEPIPDATVDGYITSNRYIIPLGIAPTYAPLSSSATTFNLFGEGEIYIDKTIDDDWANGFISANNDSQLYCDINKATIVKGIICGLGGDSNVIFKGNVLSVTEDGYAMSPRGSSNSVFDFQKIISSGTTWTYRINGFNGTTVLNAGTLQNYGGGGLYDAPISISYMSGGRATINCPEIIAGDSAKYGVVTTFNSGGRFEVNGNIIAGTGVQGVSISRDTGCETIINGNITTYDSYAYINDNILGGSSSNSKTYINGDIIVTNGTANAIRHNSQTLRLNGEILNVDPSGTGTTYNGINIANSGNLIIDNLKIKTDNESITASAPRTVNIENALYIDKPLHSNITTTGLYNFTGTTNVGDLVIYNTPTNDNSLTQILGRNSTTGAIEYVDVNSIITGATSQDTFVTGFTFNNSTYDLTIKQNEGQPDLVSNLAVLASDVYVLSGVYNPSTGIVTYTNSTGGTFQVSGFTTGMTDSYTTDAYISGTEIRFDNNIQGINFYSVDLLPLLSGKTDNTTFNSYTAITQMQLDTKVDSANNVGGANEFFKDKSGTTLNFRTLSGGSNTTVSTVGDVVKVDVTIPADTNTFVTGFTYNDSNTFTISRNDGVDLSASINTMTGLTVNGSVSATTYFGDGSNLTGISTDDNFVTGGTFSTGTLTLERQNGIVTVTGFTNDIDTFSTGGTVTQAATSGSSEVIVQITGNDGFTPYNITGLTDTFVSDFSFSSNTFTITQNDGSTFDSNLNTIELGNILSAVTFNIATSGTISATTFNGGTFNGTFIGDGSGLTGITDNDTFVTGFTYNNANTLTIERNDGINLSTSINTMTGLTVNGTLSATTYYGDGSNLTGIGGTFTGNTSATCITDLWVTNISGCSPVTIGTEAIFNQDVSGATSYWTTPNTGGGGPGSMTPAITITQQGSSQNYSGPAIKLHNTVNNENAYLFYQDGGSGADNGNAFNFISDGGFNFEASGDFGTGGTGFFKIAKGQSSFIIDDNGSAPRTDIKIHNANGGTAYARLNLGATNDYWYFEADDITTPMHIGWDDGVTEKNVFIFTTDSGTIDTPLFITSGASTNQDLLTVSGRTRTINFQMISGATDGYILTSDADGNGIWLPNIFVTGTTFASNQSITSRNDGTEIFKLSGGTNVTLSNPSSNQIKIDVTDTNTTITGFTYDDANTFTISDSDGSNYSASINTMTGLTINGDLNVNGESVFSGNSTDVVQIYGSGSTSPIFRIQGSSGELFSVTDSLVGELFAVNDISGIPILQVYSDNRIILGDNLAPSLYTTAKVTASSGSSTSIYSVPVSAYTGAWFEYTANDGTNLRAGNIASIFTASDVNHNETTTTDIGNTNDLIMDVSVSGGNATLTASATTSNWEIKTIIRSI